MPNIWHQGERIAFNSRKQEVISFLSSSSCCPMLGITFTLMPPPWVQRRVTLQEARKVAKVVTETTAER